MAELENLLLQAAGRTHASTSKNLSQDCNNYMFNKRRHSGSKIPMERSLGGSTEMGNQFNGDESDSAPSFGSDLYKDEEEKEELSKLPELAREMILAERSVKIDDYRLKKRARDSKAEMEVTGKEKSPPFSSHGRSSVRAERSAAVSDALNELRAKRMRPQEPESFHKLKDSAGVGYRDFLGFPEIHYSSDSDDGREGKFHQDSDFDGDFDEPLESKSRPIRYEDVRKITIRRSKLAKWLMEPFFEEIVAGCFVRVGIGRTSTGPKYRLCVIKNVDATELNRRYKLEGRTTDKWLNCVWGSEASAARWQMAMVSDSLPTKHEFNEWLTEMKRTGCHVPCLQNVDDKKEELQKASTFVYSAKVVKKMIEEKNSTSCRPLSLAVEKIRLKKEIEAVEIAGKVAEAEMLRTKLKEMEDLARHVKPVDARALKLMEMNLKNRAENYRNASALKPVLTNLKVGEEGFDPCARKWNRPMQESFAILPEGDHNEETTKGGSETKLEEAIEQAENGGKLMNTRAQVDYAAELTSLHDFDLPISLAALKKLGGEDGLRHAFMARKQKIEASIGYRVPNDYGKRNALTLSISDYKRRRGLL